MNFAEWVDAPILCKMYHENGDPTGLYNHNPRLVAVAETGVGHKSVLSRRPLIQTNKMAPLIIGRELAFVCQAVKQSVRK